MEGVGVTAKMTAAARARESERADRLFDDPWAGSLAGDEGFDFLAREEALPPDRPEASNPVALNDGGGFSRTLPDGVSAGSVIARMLSPGAHFVKAFGTLAAESLATGANRSPERAVLFYATDDDKAASVVERLISAAGFDPVKAGGVDQAIRIEMLGDLHDYGGLKRRMVTVEQARALLARSQR